MRLSSGLFATVRGTIRSWPGWLMAASAAAAEPEALGPAAAWRGGTPDAAVRQVWPQSACWRHGSANALVRSFAAPQDWTGSQAIAFRIHSEKATGSRIVVLFTSENPASEGADYFSHAITLDWAGWREFTLPLRELGVARQPLGWDKIGAIRFLAAGYGNTLDPTAVLRLDDVKLLQGLPAGQRMSDAELFAALDLGAPGLESVRAAVAAGRIADAKTALAAHLRQRESPRWTIEWRKPAFRDGAAKPDRKTLAAADKALRHQFDYTTGPNQKATWEFGPQIDWTANPTAGEARTHLWNESINRHFHFRQLSEAYWQTGDDKWAKEIADQILDWTDANPAVLLSSGNRPADGCLAWQTLTTGIRLADTWPNALYRCLGSPALGDDAVCALWKSVAEQARHLVKWPSGGNWLTAESSGLFTAGLLFPEFREAREWRRIALERLRRQLDEEIYPDGMEYELAAGYNNWVVQQFARIIELADLNGRRDEVPADFQAKMEKMFDYLLMASSPEGTVPGLNDSGNTPVQKLLETGAQLFPAREDFRFVASGGKEGRAPAELSRAFPYCGHYVMRSGWGRDATFLLFDSGPFGYGHQHEDKLHFVLWSHGRQRVLDAGNFSYDRSRWRRYVLGTAAHNTVLVDGQGQHRSGKRETYFWPRPWTAPAPAGNDTRWVSTPEYDMAAGSYADGYGPKNEIQVRHERRIVWVKRENVFLVSDTLTPADTTGHRYEALFHLDAAEAVVEPAGRVVRCDGLSIVPAADDALAVEIVKGRESEPVQGWANHPWRAVPTAVYQKSGGGVVRFAFVLEPVPPGAQPRVHRVERPAGDLTRIVFADGGVLEVGDGTEPGALRVERR